MDGAGDTFALWRWGRSVIFMKYGRLHRWVDSVPQRKYWGGRKRRREAINHRINNIWTSARMFLIFTGRLMEYGLDSSSEMTGAPLGHLNISTQHVQFIHLAFISVLCKVNHRDSFGCARGRYQGIYQRISATISVDGNYRCRVNRWD